MKRFRSSVIAVAIVFFVLATFSGEAFSQKLSAEEIIAKAVASIGTSEALAKSKGRMAIGKSEFVSRNPPLQSVGRAVLAADGVDFAFHATFDLKQYPMERIGLFTNKISIPLLKEGTRSPLGAFLLVNDRPLRDRLLGGSIFNTWLLFDTSRAEGKFEVEGKKKVKEKETWVLRYRPKSGLRDGSSIKLYFDAETFRHVRTVYELSEPDRGFYAINNDSRNPASGGTPLTGAMAQNSNTLIESFEDYKEANGLMLPHKYSVELFLNGVAGTNQFKWHFTIVEHRLVNDFGKGFFAFTV